MENVQTNYTVLNLCLKFYNSEYGNKYTHIFLLLSDQKIYWTISAPNISTQPASTDGDIIQ